jgi:hypothetical protein
MLQRTQLGQCDILSIYLEDVSIKYYRHWWEIPTQKSKDTILQKYVAKGDRRFICLLTFVRYSNSR